MAEEKQRIVILGGGIGGLAVGFFCARTGCFQVTVVERENHVGGLCASFEHSGFTLDFGAHKFYSVIPGIMDEVRRLMGDRLLKVPKTNRLLLRNRLTAYPLRLGDLMKTLGFGTALSLATDFGLQILKNLFNTSESQSYADYITRRFGHATYNLVFGPLADKVWGRPDTLHPDMAKTRVPASGGLEIILKLLHLKKETAETNADFFYYPRKGFGDLPEAFREGIEKHGGRVITGAHPVATTWRDGRVECVTLETDQGSQTLSCDLLISAILPADLGASLWGGRRSEFSQAAQDLEFRNLILVYVFARRPWAMEDQWVFCPDPSYIFSRVFEQKRMNPELGPADRTALCCDFTCDPDSTLWKSSDSDLARRCIQDLERAGFLHAEEVTGSLVLRRTSFYPRYGLDYQERQARAWGPLRRIPNLLLTGRIGMYNYNNADHCIDMGRFIAERLLVGQAPAQIWDDLAQRARSYKIVD